MNAPFPRPHRFTAKEFERITRSGAFGDLRVELRRGMIAEMNPQYFPHGAIKVALYDALKAGLAVSYPRLRLLTETSVAFGGSFQPMPDILVYDPAMVPADLDGPVPADAVKLVIEVATATLADDLGEKLEDYARAGLAEYWVVDVKGRMAIRHDGPSEAGYARRLPVRFEERLDSLTLSGLSLAPGALG